MADTAGGALTITLPISPNTGDTYIVKDSGGDAASNNITLDGGVIDIDGATTFLIVSNYGKATVIFYGTKWNTI